jgi:hypothetical protein
MFLFIFSLRKKRALRLKRFLSTAEPSLVLRLKTNPGEPDNIYLNDIFFVENFRGL